MEKVKLPIEICEVLNKAGISKYYDYFLWNAMQWDEQKMCKDEKYKLNRFTNNNGALKLAKAILHGYEPEETEEERKEREIKKQIKEYLETRLSVKKDILEKITKDLYKIAYGKK